MQDIKIPETKKFKKHRIQLYIIIISIAVSFIAGYMINRSYYIEGLNKLCVQTSSPVMEIKGFEALDKSQYGSTLLWCYGDGAKLGFDSLIRTKRIGGG